MVDKELDNGIPVYLPGLQVVVVGVVAVEEYLPDLLILGDLLTEMCQRTIEENRDQLEMKGYKALFDLMKYIPKDAKLSEFAYDFGEREAGESKISAMIPIALLKQCDGWGRFLSSMLERKPFNTILKKVLHN